MEKLTKSYSRIYYLAGAADIASDYKTWVAKGSNAASFGGGVFMEQFFQFCHEFNADAQLVSTADGTSLHAGRFVLEYRNPNTQNLAGLRYHAKLISYMIGVIVSIIRFRPDLLLIGVADRYWFMFYVFYFSKIKIVPFFHCTLWPRMKSFDQLTLAQKILFRMTGMFLKNRCEAVLSISDVIAPQLNKITSGRAPRIIHFRPIYERAMFKDISPPDWHRSPFRVVFVGRIAADKGIYDLLEVVRLLSRRNCAGIAFDICGTGEELSNLNNIAKREQLINVNIHGQCDRKRLHTIYSQCHVVIVPTTREFPEGFNRVSIEAVLCGRPVVISSAAIEPKIVAAAIEVKPSDIEGFANAIVKLRDDNDAYRRLCSGAAASQEVFYDKNYGWEHALRDILST